MELLKERYMHLHKHAVYTEAFNPLWNCKIAKKENRKNEEKIAFRHKASARICQKLLSDRRIQKEPKWVLSWADAHSFSNRFLNARCTYFCALHKLRHFLSHFSSDSIFCTAHVLYDRIKLSDRFWRGLMNFLLILLK